ncbi:MAG: gliding motility-associated C-terminal domain-containing protein [Bacteroidia bacterium]|nr:gliding motility-associated C-terminal domain-containing protein [Bacteroidia bacterium]
MIKRFSGKLLLNALVLFLLLPPSVLNAGLLPGNNLKSNHGFVENRGQLKKTDGSDAKEVLFYGELQGVQVFFTKNSIIYDFSRIEPAYEAGVSKSSFDIPTNRTTLPVETKKHYRLDMQFNAAGVIAEGMNAESGVSNYYLGNVKKQWISGARHFKTLRYPNLYPGIDLLVSIKPDGSGLKYDLDVQPGADPSQISYQYLGASSCRINSSGQLLVQTPVGRLVEDAPFTYQMINGKKKQVKSAFVQEGEYIHFQVADFHPTEKLVIDPSVMVWSTYYGGSGATDQSFHLITDFNGDLIMTGNTNSANFPVSTGASQTNSGGGSTDGFIVKFSAAGNRLWATYFGGSGQDNSRSCAADANGNIFFIGTTSSLNMPTLNPGGGAYFLGTNLATTANPLNVTAYVGKISTAGMMVWSSYLGGSTGENGIDVWVNANDELIVTGSTASADFPVTAGASQTVYGGPALGNVFGDMFLGKFSNAGAQQWMTYVGGDQDELGYGVTTDAQGNIFLSGQTKGGFPVTPGAYQTTYGGGSIDAVIARFAADGTRNWVSYYGGSGAEQGADIVYHNNFVYLAGYSSSNLSGPSTGVAQPTSGGGTGDGFLAKWSPDNSSSQVIWRTYTGGSGDDGIDELTKNASGHLVVGGWTSSANYPATPNAYQTTLGGGYDGHFTTFDESGQRICASYFGGSFTTDNVYGIATAPNGDVFLTGNTGSTPAQGFVITSGAFQSTKSSGLDSYLARVSEIPAAPNANFTANPNTGCSTPMVVNFTNTSISNNTCYSNTTWKWSFPGGSPSESTLETPPAVTYSSNGTYTAKLVVTNESGVDTATQNITITPGATVNAGPDRFICLGDSIEITASGSGAYTWSPATGLSSTSGATVMAKPLVTTSYIVSGTGGACPASSDTVVVTVADSLPDPKIAGSSYCPGQPISPLQVSNASNYDVTWYTDAALSNQVGTGEFYTPSGPGTWFVIMRKSGCESDVASFTMLEQTIETKIEADLNNAVIPYNMVAQNKSTNAVNCQWFLNDSLINYNAGDNYLIEKAGEYELKLICKNASGCEDVDSLVFTVIDGKFILTIPNVFTPDNDAKNDLFAFTTSGIKTLNGRIFNRWGKEVYAWEGTTNYWDGTIKGKDAPDGVYFYVVNVVDVLDKTIDEKGTVTLLRGAK